MAKILAIESSCDETAVAIIEGGKLLSSVVATQISVHEKYGGVMPEIASRLHCENICFCLQQAIDEAHLSFKDIDAFAVTRGPGLIGCLHVGLQAAKTLAMLYDKPLIPVHHLAGHIYANEYVGEFKFPLLCVVVSGGNTELVYMDKPMSFKIIGETKDDAVGECYDKVARVLGLPYPGGPEIQKLATEGAPRFHMPRPVFKDGGAIRFSYSGLKTYVVNLVHTLSQRGEDIPRADIAASFQAAAVGQLTEGAAAALRSTGLGKLSIAGGVGANALLREEAKKVSEKAGASLHYPALRYCTDNAAMIGAAAYFDIMSGAEPAPLTLDAKATVRLA